MDAKADLSLRWAHIPFCWFYHEAAHICFCGLIVGLCVSGTYSPASLSLLGIFSHSYTDILSEATREFPRPGAGGAGYSALYPWG